MVIEGQLFSSRRITKTLANREHFAKHSHGRGFFLFSEEDFGSLNCVLTMDLNNENENCSKERKSFVDLCMR